MVELDFRNYPRFTEAFMLWTGWGREMWPRRDDASVVRHFGPEAASNLLQAMRSLTDEFNSSKASLIATDLSEMGNLAKEEFRTKHPEVAEEVLTALAWCYTFDYK